MLKFNGDQGRKVIMATYPHREKGCCLPDSSESFHPMQLSQVFIYHGQPRAVQSFDIRALLELAIEYDAVIEAVASVGDTVVELTPVLQVFGAKEKIPEKRLRGAVELGEQRTFQQDPKYAIRLLVDIAIKALSPAINDPTTATQALDQIGDLLVRLGLRCIEIGDVRDEAGRLRVVVPFPTWEDFLRLAFDEIRYYGGNSFQVMRRMRALVSDLIAVLPEQRHPALKHWQGRLRGTVARFFQDANDALDASTEDRQGLGTTRRHSATGDPNLGHSQSEYVSPHRPECFAPREEG
jgi:uncharacterized membrane protein